MVYSFKITSNDGTTVVADLTNLNPSISFSMRNPVATLPVPYPATASATAYSNINTVSINFKMLMTTVNVSFTTVETGGYGADAYNFTSLTTTFQKLMYLGTLDRTKKRIYLNSTTNYLWGQITSYSADNVAGQKDIIRHNLEIVLVGNKAQ
jgi:hypothetical protein